MAEDDTPRVTEDDTPLTVNKQAVCILLECFLVISMFTLPGFPINLENLEISRNFEKVNKYHDEKWYEAWKNLVATKIHPWFPDLEAWIYNLRLFFQKISSLTLLGINIIFQMFF